MKFVFFIFSIIVSTIGSADTNYISYSNVEDTSTLQELKAKEWHSQINPFSTDGCSHFLDGSVVGSQVGWLHCCEEHDVKYWTGIGGESAHDQADLDLKQCVIDAGYPTYADLIYLAVTLARPLNTYSNVSFRWGYGWPFELNHSPLVQAQMNSVRNQISTVQIGILNYRNAKGYPLPTAKQFDQINQILQKALQTEPASEIY